MRSLDREITCTLEEYWPIGPEKHYTGVFGREIILSQLPLDDNLPDIPEPTREDVAGAIMGELAYVGAYFGCWHLDFCDRQQAKYGKIIKVLMQETQARRYRYLFKGLVEKYNEKELNAILELILDEFENLC